MVLHDLKVVMVHKLTEKKAEFIHDSIYMCCLFKETFQGYEQPPLKGNKFIRLLQGIQRWNIERS